MNDTRVKISSILESQLPDFIKTEFPYAEEFLRQYYISNEYSGGPLDLLHNIDKYVSLDAVSNITGSIVNFTQNLTGIISTTIASNNNNNFINFSNSNLNLPFSAGDNVGVLIQSQLVITGLRTMANVYFYN